MTILNQNKDFIIFTMGKSKYSFLTTGDIFEFTYDEFMINQFQGNHKDGSVNNIWLRVYNNGKINAYPLLGIQSNSKLYKSKSLLVYEGCVEKIKYKVTFKPLEENWFWNVELSPAGKTIDLLYGQDIGVGSKGGILTNELYMAQYLGHTILLGNNGYVLCSRQNQPQNNCFPYLQQGALGAKVEKYSTDGLQFFGLSYKATNVPELLDKQLPNVNYQFEFSYTALQTEKILLDKQTEVSFYGLFKPNHEEAVEKLEFNDQILKGYQSMCKESIVLCDQVNINKIFGKPYASPQTEGNKVMNWYDNNNLEEYKSGELLSFFTNNYIHVVLQQKELMMERPHGTIIATKIDEEKVNNHLMASTNYMYGLFNCQTVVGNTSFNKFNSASRGLLNILKNYGQRIYIKLNNEYRLLTLPAVYEMGMNYARWYYILPEDKLIVTSFAVSDNINIVLEVQSESGKEYDYIVTNQLVLGENEYESPVELTKFNDGKILRFSPDKTKWFNKPYKDLHYDLQIPNVDFKYSDDRIFYDDNKKRNGTLLTISIKNKSHFQLIIEGRLEYSKPKELKEYSFETELKKYEEFYSRINCGFYLKTDSKYKHLVDKLNTTAWWYSHNAMIHYASPHGLEQPGGAAWGTRDVCQGPFEFFMMTQHYKIVRSILINVFMHQIYQTKEWAQWFMFDKYTYNAGECHGDIVFWPLKCIGDYLNETGDYSILDEIVPYLDQSTGKLTETKNSIFEHIKIAFNKIEERFIGNTGLITYAGGDWDDTLQPADDMMKEKLVSSWTMALAYQAIKNLAKSLEKIDLKYSNYLKDISEKVKNAFNTLLVKDGVIAGFACRENDNSLDYMLHPCDKKTGIQYRLLPMTRSIISGIVDKEQANKNVDIIEKYLNFPDGIRLMDKPTKYNGGISYLFKRAEQAANVGREISLQYTHAHIRYIEAMAKLGFADEAWKALFKINPINIKENVPNALVRQSNLYFSSSDGMFNDRYDYSKNFEKLRDGSVKAKGGWRLYSSGPGIYLNQLISNILGVRFNKEGLIIDPVLPKGLDKLEFVYNVFGRKMIFDYTFNSNIEEKICVKKDGKILNVVPLSNEYRCGGVLISKDDLLNGSNHIEINWR